MIERATYYTEEMSAFASSLRFEDLSAVARERYKCLILDALSCGVGGSQSDQARKVVGVIADVEQAGRSTVWATGQETSAMSAAYINAEFTNALDFDDTYSGGGHPGATVVPAVIATAEDRESSGREIVAAAAVGYEVSVRLGLALRPAPGRFTRAFGYGHQTIGAAAAAASLSRLTQEQMEIALGLAAAHVPIAKKINRKPSERPLSEIKNNFGWIALAAVLACELAGRGVVGSRNFLDGEDGYWAMVGSPGLDGPTLVGDLGKVFISVATEHKPYASCRWTHSAIEAAAALSEQLSNQDEIDRVEVQWPGKTQELFDIAAPTNPIDAQFSLPFLVAGALLGWIPRGQITSLDLARSDILEVAQKVQLRPDPAFARAFETERARPARLLVRTADGRDLSRTVETAPGHPSRELDWAAVEEKSRSLVSPIWGEQSASRLIELCHGLDEVDDFVTAWRALSTPRVGQA